jgi:hypothetical protein
VDVSAGAPSAPIVIDGDIYDDDLDFAWVGNDVIVYKAHDDTASANQLRWVKRSATGFGAPNDLTFTMNLDWQLFIMPRANPPAASIGNDLIDFDTGKVVEFANNGSPLTISPDLGHLSSWSGTTMSIYPADDPALATKITSGPAFDRTRASSCGHEQWSHDGSTVAWPDPNLNLSVLDVARGAPYTVQKVAGTYGRACAELFSEDDKWMVVKNQLGSLFVSRIDGAGPTDAVQIGDPANAPSISEPVTGFFGIAPDSHRLAYEGPVQGGSVLYFASLESGALGPPERIVRIPGEHVGYFSWSADSSLFGYGILKTPGQSDGIYLATTRAPLAPPQTVVPHPDCKRGPEACKQVYFWQFQKSAPFGVGAGI